MRSVSRARGGVTSVPGGRRWLALMLSLVSVVALVQGLTFAAASRASRALASATLGTGGEFVATQGRALDTRAAYQVGPYSTPMVAGAWRAVTVGGAAGVPATGAGAVQVSVTSLNATSAGTIQLSQYLSTPKPQMALSYGSTTGSHTNTAIVALSSSGKIEVEASSPTNVVIDVQGYYTSGDTAAGGYVPVAPKRTVDTRNGTGLPDAQLAAGSTTTIAVAGTAGVPSTASAVFVNLAAFNSTASTGFLTPYAADETRPTVSLNFVPGTSTSLGTTVPLSADGKIKIYTSVLIDLTVDMVGYFDGSAASGAFTPATATVATNVAITSGTTKAITVAGVAGVPLAGSGISAVAMNLKSATSNTASAYLQVWASSATKPNTTSLNMVYGSSATVSNFVTTQIGNDGKINIYNSGTDNVSVTLTIQGWYTNSGLAVPDGQDQTQQSVTLQADPKGGGAWVTYQYRIGTQAAFVNVPVGNVKDSDGNNPTGWPVQKSGTSFTPFAWNIRDTLTALTGAAPDSLIQVQACYGSSGTDTNLACGAPANVQFTQSAFGDGFATTDLGPGSLAELTGDFEVDATDADAGTSLGDLLVGRTLTTLDPVDAGVAAGSQRGDASGVFGPGWTSDLSSAAGDADLAVTDKSGSGFVQFTDTDGGVSTYQATTSTSAYPITFAGINDAAGDGKGVSKVDSTHITMTDPDDATTTWTRTSTGTWQAASVQESGSDSTSTYTYDGSGRVTRILAEIPAGISCSSPDTTAGCRSLLLSYETLAVAGVNVTRLQKISLSVPQTGGATNEIAVADYEYTSGGLLADEYDPRISPNLKTAYTYNAAGRLATMTPSGEAAWSFAYDSTGRTSTISRPDPSGSTATTTIVYSVPLSGSDLPNVTATNAATWDETADLPVIGTAVFSPDHHPAGTTVSVVATGDWAYAAIDYVDVNGEKVNTAQYGAGAWQLDTSQYDDSGNDTWDLTAGNRAQALAPTNDTDPYVTGLSNVQAANLLASTSVYNPLDPSEVTDVFGPTHPATLHDGTLADVQTHVATTYDEGAPNDDVNPATGESYDLPTTVTTTGYNVQTGTDTGYPDDLVIHTGYDAINSGDTDGWTLGQATSSTTQMGGSPSSSDLSNITRYDTNGRTIETRLPSDPSGATAHSTLTNYYTAAGSGSCTSAKWAGLACSTGPASQPATGNPLPVTTYTYDEYGNQVVSTETYGSGASAVVRTTSTGYDTAERETSSSLSVAPASAGGTSVPTVSYAYDPNTGLPSTTSTGSGASLSTLTTAYNNIGEATDYTDAAGTVSHRTYDLDGRAVSLNDGKETTAYTYDSTTEHRGLVTGEDIGVSGAPSTLTATYDAGGNLTTETYPNGIVATDRYDNAHQLTDLTYAKAGSTWMNFTQAFNSLGQIATQSDQQSTQTFAYDPSDRLTGVQDTLTSAGTNTCTSRSYTYDANSNRKELASYPPGADGSCSQSTDPGNTEYSYDQADRLINSGYTYDFLGRTLTVPSSDARGIGGNASHTGTMNINYYANDMVASEVQGGATINYTLDPEGSRIGSSADGSATSVNHYSDTTDSPSWVSTDTTHWTANLAGPDGRLAATADQSGAVILQLANPHGDVVADVPDTATATVPTSINETTEFGIPRTAASGSTPYGWLGSAQRSNAGLGGLTLMGVRLYNPETGRFLSEDAIYQGNANAYIYPDDPVNNSDGTGALGEGIWTIYKWFHCPICFTLGKSTSVPLRYGFYSQFNSNSSRNGFGWFKIRFKHREATDKLIAETLAHPTRAFRQKDGAIVIRRKFRSACGCVFWMRVVVNFFVPKYLSGIPIPNRDHPFDGLGINTAYIDERH